MGPKVKIVPLFLETLVNTEVKKEYGEEYFAKNGNIYFKPKTYPYDKKVGYWFFKENDLFLVVTDGSNLK